MVAIGRRDAEAVARAHIRAAFAARLSQLDAQLSEDGGP